MRKVSQEDWREFKLESVSTPILETILDGQSPNLLFGWISLLYRKYRLGDWNNKIPDPKTFQDKSYLMWEDECYCLFHKKHEKFGESILECAHPYSKNVFVFFDYGSLEPVFRVLDLGGAEQVPYIPIYYAHPEDRFDFKSGSHMWE